MKELIFLVEESLDGGFEARSLGVPIFTEGDTLIQIKNNIVEAVKCHFEENEIPRVVRLHFVKEEVISI
jgi:hypothetical protein